MRSNALTFQVISIAALVIYGCQSTAPLQLATEVEAAGCKQIIYSYGVFGELGFENNIVSVCPDGSEKQRLTIDGKQNMGPSWSPDGRSIAFYSSSSGARQLHVMDADGSNQRPLTSEPNLEFSHSLWMPDGEHIALLSRSGSLPLQWQLVDIESADMQPLEGWPNDPNFHPVAFSHDGAHLIYLNLSDTDQRSEGLARQIHIQNSDGSDDHALTNSEPDHKNPRWSPDDSQIAFLAEVEASNGHYALYIINTDGSQQRQMTEPIFDHTSFFDWAPDGRSLVVFGNEKLAIIDANSGETLQELLTVPDLAGKGFDGVNLNLEQMGGGLSWQP